MKHRCVAKAPAMLVGKRKIDMCVYFIALLCSLNGLFEGDDGSQQASGGRTAGGHLDSNLTIRCFFRGCAGVSGEVGFGLASKLGSHRDSRLRLWVARLRGGKAVPGDPLRASHEAAGWEMSGLGFRCGHFRRCRGGKLAPSRGPRRHVHCHRSPESCVASSSREMDKQGPQEPGAGVLCLRGYQTNQKENGPHHTH